MKCVPGVGRPEGESVRSLQKVSLVLMTWCLAKDRHAEHAAVFFAAWRNMWLATKYLLSADILYAF